MITNKEWSKQFAIAIKDQMSRCNLTQKELSIRSGIHEGTISRYCNGKRIPNGETILLLAKTLKCSCDDLCLFDSK